MPNVISYSSCSDVGSIRTNNEDACYVQSLNEDLYLAIVVDGVGGYEGGEVAAQMAVETIPQYVVSHNDENLLKILKEAVVEANNQIFKYSRSEFKLSQMCCVLTALLYDSNKNEVHFVHVGDTRLYKYDYYENQLLKLTHDHSLVGYMEEIGDLTEEQAMKHPERNVISRVVGDEFHNVDDANFLQYETCPLTPNFALLLCSDGLTDMITTAQITEVLSHELTTEEKVKCLINTAKDAGGRDNVTVVLIENKENEMNIQENTNN